MPQSTQAVYVVWTCAKTNPCEFLTVGPSSAEHPGNSRLTNSFESFRVLVPARMSDWAWYLRSASLRSWCKKYNIIELLWDSRPVLQVCIYNCYSKGIQQMTNPSVVNPHRKSPASPPPSTHVALKWLDVTVRAELTGTNLWEVFVVSLYFPEIWPDLTLGAGQNGACLTGFHIRKLVSSHKGSVNKSNRRTIKHTSHYLKAQMEFSYLPSGCVHTLRRINSKWI